jgi:Uma2 family endonuclease
MTTATILEPAAQRNGKWDDDPLYEIVDGQKVELPPMSIHSQLLVTTISSRLVVYGETSGQGRAVAEGLFHLALPVDRNRRPDVAFVSAKRWSLSRPIPARDNAWNVVPNLAVEIISPTDMVEELIAKIEEYFASGVQCVWVVYPNQRLVHIFKSTTEFQGLRESDTLQDSEILPGFSLPLATLFPAVEKTEPKKGD